jgi:hypothetical protein
MGLSVEIVADKNCRGDFDLATGSHRVEAKASAESLRSLFQGRDTPLCYIGKQISKLTLELRGGDGLSATIFSDSFYQKRLKPSTGCVTYQISRVFLPAILA